MKNNKIYRITFSEDLAKHILTYLDSSFTIIHMTINIGRCLNDREVSSTGLYGIVAKRNNRLLRVTLSKDIAEFMCDESRYLVECKVIRE